MRAKCNAFCGRAARRCGSATSPESFTALPVAAKNPAGIASLLNQLRSHHGEEQHLSRDLELRHREQQQHSDDFARHLAAQRTELSGVAVAPKKSVHGRAENISDKVAEVGYTSVTCQSGETR